MAVIRRHWGWRTWTVVAALSILAGLAGISSELMAGATVTQFKYKGPELYAEWNLSSATTTTNAWVEADTAVTGPGVPTPTSFGYVEYDVYNHSLNQEYSFWGYGPLGPTDFLTVAPNLNSGSTSIGSGGSMAGTLNIWDWNASTLTTVAATGQGSASMSGPQYTEQEKSSDRQFNQAAGVETRSRFDGTFGWYPSGTGSVSAVDANGNTYQIIAPGTAVSAGYVALIKQGNRSVTH
jgi:hypothetical protein